MRILILTMLLSACVAAPSYDSQLQPWVGLSQETLFESWGFPDNHIDMGSNTTELTYVKENRGGMSNSADTYSSQMDYQAMEVPSYSGPNPDEQTVSYCKISFIVQNGIINNYNFNGDDCVGYIVKPQ